LLLTQVLQCLKSQFLGSSWIAGLLKEQRLNLLDEGVRSFVEVGPGKVLLGLIRSIDKSVTMLNVGDEKSVENAVRALL